MADQDVGTSPELVSSASANSKFQRPLCVPVIALSGDCSGSGPAARPPASTGGYAAHSGQPMADGTPLGLVGGLRDACRP